MDNVMKYKGFIGSVDYSAADEVFYGKLEFIDDLVNFEGTTVKERLFRTVFYIFGMSNCLQISRHNRSSISGCLGTVVLFPFSVFI